MGDQSPKIRPVRDLKTSDLKIAGSNSVLDEVFGLWSLIQFPGVINFWYHNEGEITSKLFQYYHHPSIPWYFSNFHLQYRWGFEQCKSASSAYPQRWIWNSWNRNCFRQHWTGIPWSWWVFFIYACLMREASFKRVCPSVCPSLSHTSYTNL